MADDTYFGTLAWIVGDQAHRLLVDRRDERAGPDGVGTVEDLAVELGDLLSQCGVENPGVALRQDRIDRAWF
jgi:hypothetical protein